MNISKNGIELIKQFEGCVLTAYKDSAGVPTIGYGHTAGVKMGQTITKEKAEEFLRLDLAVFENRVMKYDNIYHWAQNEFDALVSFAYNIGSIKTLTNDGKRTKDEIKKAIPLYNKAGGKVLNGLKRRREAELALFSSGSSNTEKPKEETKSSVQYYDKYTGRGNLLTGLAAVGCNNVSMASRAKIAVANKIVKKESEYRGTLKQNTEMITLLKSGKLIKP